MSVRLIAPLPSLQTTTVLPNPKLGDVEKKMHQIDIFRSINGTKRTSVKSNDRRQITYDFELDRMKAAELEAFIDAYFASKIRLVNHKNEVFDGYLMNNPFEFAQGSRSGITVHLQFEGDPVT
jgi:hypothetical protein